MLSADTLTDNGRAIYEAPIVPRENKIMYEVIWSKFSDRFIVRSVTICSTVKPMFIGTEDECNNHIAKNTSAC